jgi:hypothetical protein
MSRTVTSPHTDYEFGQREREKQTDRKLERERVCVREKERERVLVCMIEKERERELPGIILTSFRPENTN